MDLGLRFKVALAFCGLVVLAVGVTGAVLVVESASYQEGQVVERELLLVQNRALAMQGRIDVLLRELTRLSRRSEINASDGDPAPERGLLGAAHGDSVLFSVAVLLDPSGRVVFVEPPESGLADTVVAGAAWWERARTATAAFAVTEPGAQPILRVVAPVLDAKRAFGGAVVGHVSLPGLLTDAASATRELDLDGETSLVDHRGSILAGPGTAEAFGEVAKVAALGRAGTLRRDDALFAHAPVGEHGFSAVMRIPWASLTRESRVQIRSVVIMLVLGVAVAMVFALFLSRRLTRPVLALALQAETLAGRLAPSTTSSHGRDELETLRLAFAALERAIGERDGRIERDIEEIRSIAVDRERLNVELRQLADELAERVEIRTHELREAQRALLAAERLVTIGKTAGALAHELRNALNGLSMATDLLAQSAGERSSPMVRERAYREIARLRDLTDSLLSFSGAVRLQRTREDLHELLRRAVNNYYEDLRDEGLVLELDLVGGGAPLMLECDAAKAVTVFGNLLRNAIEATCSVRRQNGEEEASAESRPLHIHTRSHDGLVEIEIADRGAGLSEEARSRLFEPFFTTKRTGTGLGLVTSQRFVEAHGGTVAAVSREGGGTAFVVTLPCGAAQDTLPHGARSAEAPLEEGARATAEAARTFLRSVG